MKDILWLKSLREIVFSDLEETQFISMWKQLQALYSHGISNRKSMG